MLQSAGRHKGTQAPHLSASCDKVGKGATCLRSGFCPLSGMDPSTEAGVRRAKLETGCGFLVHGSCPLCLWPGRRCVSAGFPFLDIPPSASLFLSCWARWTGKRARYVFQPDPALQPWQWQGRIAALLKYTRSSGWRLWTGLSNERSMWPLQEARNLQRLRPLAVAAAALLHEVAAPMLQGRDLLRFTLQSGQLGQPRLHERSQNAQRKLLQGCNRKVTA